MTYLKVLQNLTLFQTQVPPDAKNEQIYILKKRVVPVTSENCRELLLFGLLTPPVLLQLSCAVKQVTVPPIFIHISHKEAFLSISNLPVWVLGELVMFFFLRKICVPLLSDNKNHQTWPLLISEDILRHVEIMCSQTSVVQGRVMGKTVLPIPIAADWMEKSHGIFEK